MKKIKVQASTGVKKTKKSTKTSKSSSEEKPYPWTKPLALVSATGFVGLVISLVLLAQYKTQIYKIVTLLLGFIFGWDNN